MTKRFHSNLILTLLTIFFYNCTSTEKLVPGEGFIQVKGGKVWYRIVGNGDKTPLLLLHGGPGVPSYYLNPLSELSNDRPVIFYDQLGCGRSDRITDTSLMTVENYVEELHTVKNALGLKDFYLLGQSWGTMLGLDYYLKYPEGVKAILFCSPAISIPMWLKDADTLISTLSDSVQYAIVSNERDQTFDSPTYKLAMQIYYQLFVARKLPWSADIDSSFEQMGENVYMYMGGPSEFTMTGSLKNYDRTNRLKEIKVPTLFITGEFDEARPSTVRYYQSLVPDSRFELIEDAAHMTMQDNPEANNRAIRNFLDNLEKK